MEKKLFYSLYHTSTFLSYVLQKSLLNTLFRGIYFMLLAIVFVWGILLEQYVVTTILVSCGLYVYVVFYVFIFHRLRSSDYPPVLEHNIAGYLDYEIVAQLAPVVLQKNTHLIFLKAALYSRRGTFIAAKLGTNAEQILHSVSPFFEDHNNSELPQIYEELFTLMQKLEETRIGAHTILRTYFEKYPVFQELFNQLDLAPEDIERVFEWDVVQRHYQYKPHPFSPEGIRDTFGTFGRSWTMGYINDLERITVNITTRVAHTKNNGVIIHQDALRNILQTITKGTRNNVLLIGEVGVGKSTIVENLAKHLYTYQIQHNLSESRVLELQTTDLLSGIKQAPQYLLNALNYAERAGNIILVIENISDLFLSSNDQIRNIILKFMRSSRINIIAIDSAEGYHVGVKKFPIISNLFTTITVENASNEETLRVLMMLAFELESHGYPKVTYRALRGIMTFADRYISSGGFPGKALDLLVDASHLASSDESPFVLEEHIRTVVSNKTNINIHQMEDNDRDTLMQLESKLREEVKGQDEGLVALSNALKRSKLDVHSTDKPIGTFLFLGSTGVGKTETAKALAKHYFGSSDRMIRLDMNEYGEADSVYGILGAPLGKSGDSEGFLSKRVQEKPFSLILLDELEKAHKNVLNVFLQVLDEGVMTDNRGIKTDFRNTIIIATSNAGAVFLRNFVKEHPTFDKPAFREQLIDEIINSGLFAPEFINRFTDVIVYYPLEPQHVVEIAYKMVEKIISDFQNERGIHLLVESEVIEYIAKKGYSMDFGARELSRTVTDILQNYLADYFLLHNPQRGDSITVTLSDIVSS